MRVCKHLRQTGRQAIYRRDIGHALVVAPERKCFTDDLVHIKHGSGCVAFSREGQEITHNFCSPFGLSQDGFNAAFGDGIQLPTGKAFGPGQDRGQWIVQFMGDARHSLSKRCQFLGLKQLVVHITPLVFQFPAFTDVAQKGINAARAIRFGVVKMRGYLDPHG